MIPFVTRKGVPMKAKPPRLVTVGVIAGELGVSVDKVSRLLRSRPHIEPRAYAGNIRLFDNVTIAQLRQELIALEARRAGGNQ
jgi:hypothetical protein